MPLVPCRGPPAAAPVRPNNVVTSIYGAPYGYPRRAHVPAPWSLAPVHRRGSFSGQNIPWNSQAAGLPPLLLISTMALMPVQTTITRGMEVAENFFHRYRDFERKANTKCQRRGNGRCGQGKAIQMGQLAASTKLKPSGVSASITSRRSPEQIRRGAYDPSA
ncbi:hypothetical protein BDP55DRAFT_627580 [Colletotrichum godetiae]|uniref:Uncharacterized protein n=1 Tax=Colletotrichum godetiae TaxID=1209918 RepID=A0AAJ0EXC9_9PEZI|nr:uncharacterized protein BDP55DRAFT_627580 [Colletotrichum godetiae]KAK1690894.1 hypothetical protein BDP55DRAFT_627580 [Colletotrichum godetiae]